MTEFKRPYTPRFQRSFGSRGSGNFFKRSFRAETRYNKNHDIRAPEVRLIGSDGTNYGVVDIRRAMTLAHEQELDLVEVSPNAEPPVCRIVSWSKFMYEQKKKEKEARKHKQKELKEFRFGTFIAEGDKLRQVARATEFLRKGHNVKLSVTRRGRIPVNQSKALLQDLLTHFSGYSTIDPNPYVEGRQVSITLKGALPHSKPVTLADKADPNAKTQDKENRSEKIPSDKASGRQGLEDPLQQKSAGPSSYQEKTADEEPSSQK